LLSDWFHCSPKQLRMRAVSAYAGFIAFFSKVLPRNRRIFPFSISQRVVAFGRFLPVATDSFWPIAAFREGQQTADFVILLPIFALTFRMDTHRRGRTDFSYNATDKM